jgi:hypothetical protein
VAFRSKNLRSWLNKRLKKPSSTLQDVNAPNQDVKRNTVNAFRLVFCVILAGAGVLIVSIVFQQHKLRRNRAWTTSSKLMTL